ncbi:MAG: DNA repair protein RecO [Gemmatimonadota bacterium]
MAPVSTRAVLLRGHDYGETSRILRFLTEDRGLVSVMARGVRGRTGKGTSAADTFSGGVLTVYMKPGRDLQTMKDFTVDRPRAALGRHLLRFAAASAAAELVLAHAEASGQAHLYDTLERELDLLTNADAPRLPSVALATLWGLAAAFGFAPELATCVRCGAPIPDGAVARFDLPAGGLRCPGCAEGFSGPRVGPESRRDLGLFLAGGPGKVLSHPRRHLNLLSDFLAFHLVSRPLKALTFLADAFPLDEA